MANSVRFAILGLVVLFGGMVPTRTDAQVLAKTLLFNTVQPCRVADTRSAVAGILVSGVSRTFNIVGATTNYSSQGGVVGGCGIPGFVAGVPQVAAVAINIVATDPVAEGFLAAWPSDHGYPGVSTLNYQKLLPSLSIANGVIVPVRQDAQGGDITLVAGVANTHVVMDIVGYFSKAEPRKYYLTKEADAKTGGEALTACATGYHMASLWEIFDTSNLSYNTSLGETKADSGSGPPVLFGWIRTGRFSWGADQIGGLANCLVWTSSAQEDFGSVVEASSPSWEDPATTVSPWRGHAFSCNNSFPVWCVED